MKISTMVGLSYIHASLMCLLVNDLIIINLINEWLKNKVPFDNHLWISPECIIHVV